MLVGNKKFLSRHAEDLAVHFVVVHGASYDKFAAFARENNWETFTESYFYKWLRKPRIKRRIEAERDVARAEARERIQVTRDDRLAELQATLARCNRLLSDDLSVSDVVRLEEQKRKTLEAIAKERGEWNDNSSKAPLDRGTNYSAAAEAALAAMRERKALPEPSIDGEFEEVFDDDEGDDE